MAQQQSSTGNVAVVTIFNLTQPQRAAVRRLVARRNERMWDGETFVSVERGKLVIATNADPSEYGERGSHSLVSRAAHAEARQLMLALGRTFEYDVNFR